MPAADAEPLSLGQRAVLLLLRLYKGLLSPLYSGSCRFVPSCSDYAAEAIRRFGVARGAWLTLVRLSKCHPLGRHGLDPVPSRPRRT